MLIKFFIILFTFYFPFFLLILVFVYLYLILKIFLFLLRRAIFNKQDGATPLYLSLYNPREDFHLHLPLDYIMLNFKITLIKILLYIILFFYLFFNLRYFRLGKEVNIYLLISKILSYSWYILLIGIFVGLIMLCIIALLWNIFYKNFYKELKKVHIYLHQFGGELDENVHLHPNVYGLALEPYYSVYFLTLVHFFNFYFFRRLYILVNSYPNFSEKSCNTEYLKKNYSIINFYRNLDLPIITYPLYYYLHVRPHNNSKLRKSILFFFNELLEGHDTCFKYLPYAFMLVSFILEVYFFNGIIYYFFYVLAIIFFFFIKMFMIFMIKNYVYITIK